MGLGERRRRKGKRGRVGVGKGQSSTAWKNSWGFIVSLKPVTHKDTGNSSSFSHTMENVDRGHRLSLFDLFNSSESEVLYEPVNSEDFFSNPFCSSIKQSERVYTMFLFLGKSTLVIVNKGITNFQTGSLQM